MTRFHYATRSAAAKLSGIRDYRTVERKFQPSATMVRANGEIVPLYLVWPTDERLAELKKKD